MNGKARRRGQAFRPSGDFPLEGRLLLSATRRQELKQVYHQPLGYAAVRPDTPVLPYAAKSSVATFIDPTAQITHGQHVVIGGKTFVAPYAKLNAQTGFIKIGSASSIEDNATIASNPTGAVPTTNVTIGDNVVIGYGATVLGPSTIGAFSKGKTASKPTWVGPNALIDGATIQAGAVVGALARVGPGITIPSGMYVIPGSNVTTQAEASNPALGMVEAIPTSVATELSGLLSHDTALPAGYATLFQGQSATGASIEALLTVFDYGNLAAVEGASAEPSSSTVSFEPSTAHSPAFLTSYGDLVEADLYNFTARIIGQVAFNATAGDVQSHLGRSNSIRGDEGQAITFGSAPTTGNGVTITSPISGALTIGQDLQVGDGAVVLGGTSAGNVFGNNVSIGSGAVVSQSNIGNGATIGARSYISGSTIADGATVAPGSIIINNKLVGSIAW